jgi:hypothetical protein
MLLRKLRKQLIEQRLRLPDNKSEVTLREHKKIEIMLKKNLILSMLISKKELSSMKTNRLNSKE